MAEQTTLESKRKEAREEILILKEKIAPAMVFSLIKYVFPKLDSTKNPFFWVLNILFINFIMLVPGVAISFLLNEMGTAKDFWLIWIIGVEISVCALLATYIVAKNILNEVSHGIIRKINNIENISELMAWLSSSWASKSILGFILPIWIIWVFLSIGGVSYSGGRFVGFGPSVTTIPTGFVISISFYVVLWIMRLSHQIGKYKYDLNNLVPANSEVVDRISKMFNDYLYVAGIFFALATLLSSFIQFGDVVGYPFVFAGWVTITTQFIINRSTVGKIVGNAKWETLNKIQKQMNDLQLNGNFAEKEAAEALFRLSDVHQKILATRSINTDPKGFLNFFSQMMLPLLGLLLANLDKVLDLLPK